MVGIERIDGQADHVARGPLRGVLPVRSTVDRPPVPHHAGQVHDAGTAWIRDESVGVVSRQSQVPGLASIQRAR